MKSSIFPRALPLLAAALVAAGCGDDGPTDGGSQIDPGVSFSYSGAEQGSFTAEGTTTVGAGGSFAPGTWAVAGRSETDNDLVVVAFRQQEGNVGDALFIFLPAVTAPRAGIAFSDPDTGTGAVGAVGFELDLASLANDTFTADRGCLLLSGSVNVTAISDTNVQGTFAGQAICVDEAGQPAGILSVANGQFNVPVLAELDPDDITFGDE